MSDTNYPNNSYAYREKQKEQAEKKKVTKVASGKTKKKKEIHKLTDVFISEDIHNVKSYVMMDVLIPAIKKAISDIVTNGIDMILYGESGRTKKRSNVDYASYRSYYDKRDDRRESKSTSRRFDYDEVIFESRGEAEAVRDQMEAVIDQYGVVTVADLYDMADLTAPPYTSTKYGWTSIRYAEVARTRDGYIIKLPRAMPID